MPQSKDSDILTTFQAAKLCGVSHKSIERWIDAGLLKGYRTPGGHRRLNRSDLLTLIANRRTDRGGSIADPAAGPVRVLMVGELVAADPAAGRQLTNTGRFDVTAAASCFEAGVLVERLRPHVLVVDVATDCQGGAAIWNLVRNDATHSAVVVLGIAESPESARGASGSGLFHATLVSPLGPADLLSAIDGLVEDARFLRNAIADT